MIPLSFTLFLKNKLQRVVELMGLRKPSNTLNRDQPELNKILHYYTLLYLYSIISHRRFVKFKFYDEYIFRTE
jgi:hypothetical protein